MYFLSLAIRGMRERLLTSFLVLLTTTLILLLAASIQLWGYWLESKQDSLKVNRVASVLLDSSEDEDREKSLEDALSEVMAIPEVYDARVLQQKDFMEYARTQLPALANSLENIDADLIPKMLEVTLNANLSDLARRVVMSEIRSIPGVLRIDEGVKQAGEALTSISWLGKASIVLAIGLWLGLVVLTLVHYQHILFRDWKEIHLVQHFGASKNWILAPWLVEGLIYSLLASFFAVAITFFAETQIAQIFNQFFQSMGFEPFALNLNIYLFLFAILFAGAALAHIAGTLLAIFRGRVAS